jgi:hypothetical protein
MKRPEFKGKNYDYIIALEKYIDYLENKDKEKKPTKKKLDSHDLGGGYVGEALLSCT